MKCGIPLPDDANFCFKCGCDLRNLNQRVGTETCAAKIDEVSSSVSNLKCLSGMSSSLAKVGDYIKFGSYPQNNGGTKEPIEWLVLEVSGNEALLVSRYGLDFIWYHHEFSEITWENCGLRKWLNIDFGLDAFSAEERRKIKYSKVVNDDNRIFGTSGGNNTWDCIFCLSLAEAERYFKNDHERRCQPTALAKAHGGAYVDYNSCDWWLRSPGRTQGCASFVHRAGKLDPYGSGVMQTIFAVRPALWVNPESGIF